MTDKQTPPDWVLIEAAKRAGLLNPVYELRHLYDEPSFARAYTALCNMIERYEQPPVDRKLLCAREIMKYWTDVNEEEAEAACIRAIELWEEGFGK